jgi:hypothetical protein
MILDRLRALPPLSTWPVKRLRAVGTAYRQGAGEGLDRATCYRLSIEAYVVAGGDRAVAPAEVAELIAAVAAELPGWLWGPAQDWLEQQSHPARSAMRMMRAAA